MQLLLVMCCNDMLQLPPPLALPSFRLRPSFHTDLHCHYPSFPADSSTTGLSFPADSSTTDLSFPADSSTTDLSFPAETSTSDLSFPADLLCRRSLSMASRLLRGRCRLPPHAASPLWRRLCTPAAPPAVPPTRAQLFRLAIASGTPFVGFGIADNGIMIIAGDHIDATLGVQFGLSTLAAAGLGNLISDVCGISLGESIEHGCARLGLRAPPLSEAQNALRVTRMTKVSANAVGISIGCLIGMLPLLFMRDRKQVYFDDDELMLYQNQFAPYGVSPQQFFSLLHHGKWHVAEAGTPLVHCGDKLDSVMFLLSGEASAFTKGPGRRLVYVYEGRHSPDDAPSATTGPHLNLRRGSIIGGTALIEPELMGKPYPNTVEVTQRTKYLVWKTAELRAAMKEDKSVEAAVFSTLYLDLVQGLRQQKRRASLAGGGAEQREGAGHDEGRKSYQTMLQAVVADGVVHPLERQLLGQVAEKHSIRPEEHERMLESVGWTSDL
ncbi:hypothetical protein AB1Y20_011009 [Prymnesium parvum]|uniref:Cyclic nucleotide-binding domain-containing protein n=1 Tax=Prymnesium parvum TaxID=97485 RepID=A0AB34IN41_PRYPA